MWIYHVFLFTQEQVMELSRLRVVLRYCLLACSALILSACGGGGGGGQAPSTYTIGGTVSGLTGTVVLRNNNGDDLPLSSNGSFQFATQVPNLGSYIVSITSQPSNQFCYINNGTGTVNSHIATIEVACYNTLTLTGRLGGGLAYDVVIQNQHAFVTSGEGIQILDISNPLQPESLVFFKTLSTAVSVAITSNYLYVAVNDRGLQVIDISNPASPTSVGYIDTPGSAIDVVINGNYAYVADYDSLQIINISNPAFPTITSSYNSTGVTEAIAVSGNYAYVATGETGLQVINILNPATPTLVSSYDTPGSAKGVTISGEIAYVADVTGGLQIINISNPANPTFIHSYDTLGYTRSVTLRDNYAFVANDSSGMAVTRVPERWGGVPCGVK